MRQVRHGACLVLVLAAAAVGATPPESPFPSPPPVPQPMPAPPPAAGVIDLGAGQMYVVNSKADGALFVHPEDLVSVVAKKGPLTIDGLFADAKVPGESETRDYAGPFVWVVKSVPGKSGKATALFIPKQWTDPKEILRDRFTVNGGGVAPKPDPAPVVSGTGEWVVVVANEANPTPAQGKLVDGPTLRALKSAGKCRVYTDVSEADKVAAKGYDRVLANAGVKSPALIVLDGVGKPVLVQALPADEAALAAALKGAMKP